MIDPIVTFIVLLGSLTPPMSDSGQCDIYRKKPGVSSLVLKRMNCKTHHGSFLFSRSYTPVELMTY